MSTITDDEYENARDKHIIIPHREQFDSSSQLFLVSVSDIWCMVVRKYNNGRTLVRLQKMRGVSDADDELVDLDPIT